MRSTNKQTYPFHTHRPPFARKLSWRPCFFGCCSCVCVIPVPVDEPLVVCGAVSGFVYAVRHSARTPLKLSIGPTPTHPVQVSSNKSDRCRCRPNTMRLRAACNLHFTGGWTDVVAAAVAVVVVVGVVVVGYRFPSARGGRKPFRVYSHKLAQASSFARKATRGVEREDEGDGHQIRVPTVAASASMIAGQRADVTTFVFLVYWSCNPSSVSVDVT